MGDGPHTPGWTNMLWPAAFLLAAALCLCSYHYWDQPAAQYFSQHKDLKPAAKILTLLGDSLWYLPTSFLGLLIFRYAAPAPLWFRRCGFIFLSVLSSGLVALILKAALGRARPDKFLELGRYGFEFFQLDSRFQSFPSGHATTCLALACALSCLFPRWGKLLIPFGIALAFTRVILTVHFVSDIVAGCGVGLAAVLLVQRFFAARNWSLHEPGPVEQAKPAPDVVAVPIENRKSQI